MKKLLTTLFILFVVLSVQSQKIKVKKGEIFVDKVKIGSIEKIKVKNDSLKETYFKVTDNKGTHVFSFRTQYTKSLLYDEDKKFNFYTIEYIEKQKRAGVQNPKYYPSQKQMAKYLVAYNLLNKEGIIMEGVAENILSKELFPPELSAEIAKEKELLSYVDFKVDRLLSDPIFIFFDKTKSGTSNVVSHGLFSKSRYNIYQGVKDPKTNEFISKTFIGYAIAERKLESLAKASKTDRPNPNEKYSLVVYNTKEVPLASYLFITYSVYHPFESFPPTKTKLGRIKKVEERIKYIVNDLLNKEKI